MAKKQDGGGASSIGVYHDHQRRTCLLVIDGEQVEYIPLDIQDGFQVHTTSAASFNQRYVKMPDYPLDRAAQLYLNYAMAVGATDEVIDYLAKIIHITDEDRKMATSKRAEALTKPAKKKVIKKRGAAKKAAPVKKAGKTEKKTVKKRRTKGPGKYTSAAQMFQGLIMEGRFTDDAIFAKVQEAFGLDDNKRSYVRWYRNNLIKKGMNPPEAK